MATSRNAWGIDVGNRALKAVRLSRDGDGFRIDDFDVIEHETPLSQSGDNREALISKALSDFVSRHKTGSVPVGIAVSGQQSFARFIKLPPVEDKRIPEIVKFEAIQQIPFPLDDVEWSYQLFRKADDPDVEVGIFAMRKELVNRHVAAYTDVNLNVQVVQMSPLALYNGLQHDGKLDGTTLIIDMGADTTDLVVADGEQVWHRSIPIGGNNFTETLVRAFKLDFAKAEAMKREASTSRHARQIFQAMRPVFADLVAEIQRSVGFYGSTHREAKIKKAIALGGTFKLPGLQKYLQQNLQMDVERLESFAATAPSDPRILAAYQENALSAGTAYGLAVQAAGDGKITSSLLPSRIRKEKIWRDKQKYFAAAAALFVAGAGISLAGAYLPKVKHDAAEEDRSKIATALREAGEFDSSWSAIEGAGETDRNTIKNVRLLKADRTLWPHIVATIREALPSENVANKSVPRAQRKFAVIDEWQSLYLPDVGPLLADATRARFASQPPVIAANPSGEGGGGGFGGFSPSGPPPGALEGFRRSSFGAGSPGAGGSEINLQLSDVPKEIVTAATGKQGYLLRISGVTPYKEASRLLDETFLTHLLDTRIGHEGRKRDFYIADAFLVRQTPLSENSARLNAMRQAHIELEKFKAGGTTAAPGSNFRGGGGGFDEGSPPRDFGGFGGGPPPNYGNPGGNAPGAPGTPAEDPAPFLDPATGEDTRSDVEFFVVLFVVLDTPPAAPTAAAAAP